MATYKLIQDIEAEDKILGPLTLREFIFALIAIFLFYLCFIFVTKGATFLLVIFLPPALFFGFFAMPFGRDQPTEIWALAKLRFWFKPRQRVWSQSGVKELVTITVPKKVERVFTNGLSQGEVRSRLRALADTIDSRGWAVKNVNLNTYAVPSMMSATSDRLLDMTALPQDVPDDGIVAADDMLDEKNNPIAQQFDSMINQSAQSYRRQLVDRMKSGGASAQPAAALPVMPQAAPAADYWFMNSGPTASQAHSVPSQIAPPVVIVDPAEEAALASQLKAQAASHPTPYGNLRTMRPLSTATAAAAPAPPQPAVTAPADPAILSLAENDDLNVATLAREAKRAKGDDDRSQDEIVIPLH